MSKSKDYSNTIKNEQYEHLLHKYTERFLDADKNQLIKKLNSLGSLSLGIFNEFS
jgi:hypothetical protein